MGLKVLQANRDHQGLMELKAKEARLVLMEVKAMLAFLGYQGWSAHQEESANVAYLVLWDLLERMAILDQEVITLSNI